MDAMILAAGLGTRLGELTRDRPKALVDVGGAPALAHVARALIGAGADRLIINVHHHAAAIIEYVESQRGFGVDVHISHERDTPLETGGGLLHAAPLFRRDAPFFLHNADVICDVDLRAMYDAHVDSAALATLAVDDRESTRYLLFDDDGLAGRFNARTDRSEPVRTLRGDVRRFAFDGIHVVSPRLLDLVTEHGAFSIMDVYLRLAAAGERILPHHIGTATWLEIGNPTRLEAARRWMAERQQP